ncbi:MAG: 3-dehydroquinate synthase [Spirochaetales bacterium]|nr:3-dehydroquinate synthase [Spirochaetales bacterium]
MKQINVRVRVQPQKYTLSIGYDILKSAVKTIVDRYPARKYAIITDSTVKELYGGLVLEYLQNAGVNAFLIDFPAGELHKTMETKRYLDNRLLDVRFQRDSIIIALGGGVVGDVAGFVAATYMRGIPFYQIPTTVMAQADSSIGGKTAVDCPQGKNLIGAFHHPVGVFIDTKTLSTLDERNYRSGLIEIIKHGLIRDAGLISFIRKHLDIILSRGGPDYPSVITSLMTLNCRIKNDVVAKDAKENNLRKILNYGHTIGHAIEHLSGYSLLHGEAVATGIAAEAYLSLKCGYLSAPAYTEQISLIRDIGLPFSIPDNIGIDDIIETMYIDKKARSGKPSFVMLAAIGKVKLFKGGKTTTAIEETKLRSMLAAFMESPVYP